MPGTACLVEVCEGSERGGMDVNEVEKLAFIPVPCHANRFFFRRRV